MRKIFFTILFCCVLSLALADLSLAKDCEDDAPCADMALCDTTSGLLYGYYCKLTPGLGYKTCVLDYAGGHIGCNQECCNDYCSATVSGSPGGICYSGTASQPVQCTCLAGSGSVDVPDCWRGTERAYELFCPDGACQHEFGETTDPDSPCYCQGDCRGCRADCANSSQCVAACPYCVDEDGDGDKECSSSPADDSATNGAPNNGTTYTGNGFGLKNPLAHDTFEGIIGALSSFLRTIGLAIAPVMLIIAGFMFVTSGGSPEKAATARRLALYTLIGLAVIILASGLIKVLQSIIGYTG